MAEYLNKKQLQDLQEIFDLCDSDRDKKLTTRELGTIMRGLGQKPSEIELQEIVNEVDLEGTGKIDFKEFIRIMTRKMKDTDLDQEMKDTFRVMDVDANGLISTSDLRTIVKNLGENYTKDEVEEMILEGDIDSDKQISYDEFIRIMMSK